MTEPNGRVTTRDLLTAVESMEGRVTTRIDRLEAHVTGRLDDVDERVSVVERWQEADDVRADERRRIAGGVRATVLAVVSVVSGLVGAAATIALGR